MGEIRRDALRVGFDRAVTLEFHGAKVSSDASLLPDRDLDEAAQLPKRPDRVSRPPSWGRNIALLARADFPQIETMVQYLNTTP